MKILEDLHSGDLLAQNPDNPPINRVNLLASNGDSQLNLHRNFNTSQMKFYNSLKSTQEISMVHGGFGTGKTRMIVAICTEIASIKQKKNLILYAAPIKSAVDDVARHFEELNKPHKRGLNILCLCSLPDEKKHACKHFDKQTHGVDHFASFVSDAFISEFAIAAYLRKIAKEYKELKSRGDPRHVLKELSLAKKVNDILIAALDERWQDLRVSLREYGIEGFSGTDKRTRTTIKLEVDDLMATAIKGQDVIVATMSNHAKVNLTNNYNPVAVVSDEAALLSELRQLVVLGLYSPRAHPWLGYFLQQRNCMVSAGR